MQEIWRLLVPGKRKINLFSISFFCSNACVLPPVQRLHTALNTQLRISIEASFVVLASCVIELRIYIRAHDATAGSSVLAGQPAGCGTWLGIRHPGEVTLGADRGSKFGSESQKTVRRKGLCLLQPRTRHRRDEFQQMVRRSAAAATVAATASSRAC